MNRIFSKHTAALLTMLLTAVCMTVPSLALTEVLTNPATGDGSGAIIPLMAGLLGLSVVLLIVYFVLSAKKKKRK